MFPFHEGHGVVRDCKPIIFCLGIFCIDSMKSSSSPNGYSRFVVPLLTLIVLVSFPCVLGIVEEDVPRCLRWIKDSLIDPQGKLATWSFSKSSGISYICEFVGVTCWSDWEGRLLGLQLRGFGLSGSVPQSLKYCGSLQNLDLSGNQLSGFIPDICSWLPYLVTVDLSDNILTCSIPHDLANCNYMNKLTLANNRLSGVIPDQFSRLNRLREFSVANNDLEGSIPYKLIEEFGTDAFNGNSGLCKQLGKCGLSERSLTIISAAGGFGVGFSLMFGFGLLWRWR